VALDSSRLTIRNARSCNYGVSAHTILLWRSLVALLVSAKHLKELSH
jgi:hypothetical protein